MAALTSEDFAGLREAILEAFSREDLIFVVRTGMKLRLEWIVRDAGLETQVTELLGYTERHQQTGCLLVELARSRPTNTALQDLAQRYPPESAGPVRPATELIRGAVAAFEVVPQLLIDPEVRGRFAPFIEAYQKANTAIDRLHCYKRLHHCLHVLQKQEREISGACDALAGSGRDDGDLEIYADDLERAAEQAEELVGGLETAGQERTWIHNLKRAIVKLRQAADQVEAAPGLEAQRLLRRILVRDPSRIHGLIFAQCQAIPLRDLVLSLRLLGEATQPTSLHERLRQGMTAFEDTQVRLNRLVHEHAAWNDLDNSLRLALQSWQAFSHTPPAAGVAVLAAAVGPPTEVSLMEEDFDADQIDQLLADWTDVSEKYVVVLREAPGERRLERLNTYAQELEKASQCHDIGSFCQKFERFCVLAQNRFVEVDESLMNLASDLTRVGAPLRAIVEILQ